MTPRRGDLRGHPSHRPHYSLLWGSIPFDQDRHQPVGDLASPGRSPRRPDLHLQAAQGGEVPRGSEMTSKDVKGLRQIIFHPRGEVAAQGSSARGGRGGADPQRALPPQVSRVLAPPELASRGTGSTRRHPRRHALVREKHHGHRPFSFVEHVRARTGGKRTELLGKGKPTSTVPATFMSSSAAQVRPPRERASDPVRASARRARPAHRRARQQITVQESPGTA